jgi:hypothetical protein
MNEEDAVRIVQRLKDSQGNETGGLILNAEEKAVLERLMSKL